jgi:hypothetical protein
MHKGARTDLCGGRGVTRVPTATDFAQAGLAATEPARFWDPGWEGQKPAQEKTLKPR